MDPWLEESRDFLAGNRIAQSRLQALQVARGKKGFFLAGNRMANVAQRTESSGGGK